MFISLQSTPAGRFFRAVFAALLFVGLTSRSARTETWAERLGFPSGAKVLILHAQEMGLCYETNAAAARLMESGAVRCGAAIPPAPWFADVARWSTEHPTADVGLELTINSEIPNYRWRPVASDNLVATLLDPARFMWPLPTQTMVNAQADDVEQELLAQINYARSIGLQPTHLTTHLGSLVTRPDLIEVYLRVARQQWIPAMAVELTPEQVERFRRDGYPLPDDIIALLASYPLPKVDDLRRVAPAESYDAKKQAFLTMLHDLPPGITQIAVFPAVESDSVKRILPDWQQRVWDNQLMSDDAVRKALQRGRRDRHRLAQADATLRRAAGGAEGRFFGGGRPITGGPMKRAADNFAFVVIASAAASIVVAATATAQVPNSYGSYYTQNFAKTGGGLGTDSANRYLYDKYFYQRPTVSPYLNLGRSGTNSATSYQSYVRPELERREANATASRAYVQQRKLEGRIGETRLPGAGFSGGTINNALLKPAPKVSSTPSAYYNHWYGGWNK